MPEHEHDGSVKTCPDCAIIRWRSRPPRIKARNQPHSFADFWSLLGTYLRMERTRVLHQLRGRWRRLPERIRTSHYARSLARDYRDQMELLEALIEELETHETTPRPEQVRRQGNRPGALG